MASENCVKDSQVSFGEKAGAFMWGKLWELFISAFRNEWSMQDISKQDFGIKHFTKYRLRKLIKE